MSKVEKDSIKIRRKASVSLLILSMFLMGCSIEHEMVIQEIKLEENKLRVLVYEREAYYYGIKICHNSCPADKIVASTWEQEYKVSKDFKKLTPLKRIHPHKFLDSPKLINKGFVGWEEKGHLTSNGGYYHRRMEGRLSNNIDKILTESNSIANGADLASMASRNGKYFALWNVSNSSKNTQWNLYRMGGSAVLIKVFEHSDSRKNSCPKTKTNRDTSVQYFLKNDGKEVARLNGNDQLAIYHIEDNIIDCYAFGFKQENITFVDVAWLESGLTGLGYNPFERKYYLFNFLTRKSRYIDIPHQTEYSYMTEKGWDPVNHKLFLTPRGTRNELVQSIMVYDYEKKIGHSLVIAK